MKIKLALVAVVASVGMCAQGFGFELLNSMLGMGGYGCKSNCCDGGSAQKYSGGTQKAGGCAQKSGGRCGLLGCGCNKASQKGSVQKGHGGLFGGCGCAGKASQKSCGGCASQKSGYASQKGSTQKSGCRTPLFGGCHGCASKGGSAQKGGCGSAQKGCGGAAQKGGCGCHGGLLSRLFSCNSCGGKGSSCGGKGSSKGMMGGAEQVPNKYPSSDKIDSYVPPAPVVDPASFVPHKVTALAR